MYVSLYPGFCFCIPFRRDSRITAHSQSTWVPHDYLSSVSRGLLLHFLRSGVRVTLETESKIATKDSVIGEDIAEAVLGVDEEGKRALESSFQLGPPRADTEAQEKIPGAWTVSFGRIDLDSRAKAHRDWSVADARSHS